MLTITPIAIALFISLSVYIIRRRTRLGLSDVPGPQPESYWLGNLRQLFQVGASKADLEWQKQYGSIVRFKGPFGEDRLLISDPKALQTILNYSAYHFPKAASGRRAIALLVNGPNLVSVDGDVHKRQRKVMLPAFGGPESRALFPVFKTISEELVLRWIDLISGEREPVEINIPSWLSRATLDAIGEAAFDYQFGALDNAETELGKAYSSIVLTLFGLPTKSRLIQDSLIDHLPATFVMQLYNLMPTRRFARMREIRDASLKAAKTLVDEKHKAVLTGNGSKDVMSLLLKANISENPQTRLSEEELYAEMRVILFAGHETTSSSLTWTLWELAKHPEVQTRLRNEIRETEAKVRARGSEMTLHDIESMPYLQAVLKEGMRIHPAVGRMTRISGRDNVVPLAKPLRTLSGKIVNEIVIPKGTKIMLSIAAYNRDPDAWGPDAHVFNPDRWLSGSERHKDYPSVGVVGNLMTFSSGTRACIGWRFAMIEMQSFLVNLVNNFNFAPTEKDALIRREGSGLMFPLVDGEVKDGVKLPLYVSIAARDE